MSTALPRALRAKLFANSAPLMGVADGVVLAEQTAKGDKAAMLAAVTKLGAKIYDGRTEPRAVGTVTCISHTTERLKDDVITVKFDAVTLHLKRQSKHWKHYRPVLQDDDEENSAAAASPPLQSPAKRPRFAPKEIYKPEEPQHISKDDLMAMKHVAEAAIAAAAAAGAPPADPFGHDATVERIRAGYIAYQAAIDAGNREAAWEALLTFCRACFCYAELVRSIAAASLGPFCEEVFPLLRPKGSWMEMLASFGQVIDSLSWEVIGVAKVGSCHSPAEMKLDGYVQTEPFQTQYGDYLNCLGGAPTDENGKHYPFSEFAGGRPAFSMGHGGWYLRAFLLSHPFIKRSGETAPGAFFSESRDGDTQRMIHDTKQDHGVAIHPEDAYVITSASPVLLYVKEIFTFEEFFDESDPVTVTTIWTMLGKELISNKMGYLKQTEMGASAFVTDQSIVFLRCLDQFSFEELDIAAQEPGVLAKYVQALSGGLMGHRTPQHDAAIKRTAHQNAINVYALIEIINRFRDDNKISTTALADHGLLSQYENVPEQIKMQVARYDEQTQAGLWQPNDLEKAGMRRNFWSSSGKEPSPWLICALILCGNPNKMGRKQ